MPIFRLIQNKDGSSSWEEIDRIDRSKREKDKNGMTIDQLINRDGGILNHADNKIYSSKRSYLDAIKSSGCYIKE